MLIEFCWARLQFVDPSEQLDTMYTMFRWWVIEDSRLETLDLSFVVVDICQLSVLNILGKLTLLGEFESA